MWLGWDGARMSSVRTALCEGVDDCRVAPLVGHHLPEGCEGLPIVQLGACLCLSHLASTIALVVTVGLQAHLAGERHAHTRAHMHTCVHACMRACVHACLRACTSRTCRSIWPVSATQRSSRSRGPFPLRVRLPARAHGQRAHEQGVVREGCTHTSLPYPPNLRPDLHCLRNLYPIAHRVAERYITPLSS